MDFVIGGASGAISTVITNPFDVIKTRLQLQGELQTGTVDKQYKGLFHGMYIIGKNEGIQSLQKGLVPAIVTSLVLNSFRLGTYRIVKVHGFDRNSDGKRSFPKTVFWSSLCGALGGAVSNPVAVVKTRIQSFAHPSIAVGTQHEYNGLFDAFRKILKTEGVGGFYAGLFSFSIRIGVGSGAQLTSYTFAKDKLEAMNSKLLLEHPVVLTFLSSLISGGVVSTVACPLDVITIRLYNQGKNEHGNLKYNNIVDCAAKILKTEGLYGLYKGLGPLYLRLAPHTTISLVLWDFVNDLINKPS